MSCNFSMSVALLREETVQRLMGKLKIGARSRLGIGDVAGLTTARSAKDTA